MNRRAFPLVLAIVLSSGPAHPQGLSAQAKGMIADPSGRPVAGARIIYTRKPQVVRGANGKWKKAPGDLAFTSTALTDANGRYQLPGLPPGAYEFCMDAPGYLSTCEWSGWRWAALGNGHIVDHGTVVLTRAATVTIQIDDSQSRLVNADTKALPLAVGVRELTGKFHAARRVAVNGTSHIFQVDVPRATPLHLWLQSWKLQFTDSTGAAIDSSGTRLPFVVGPNTVSPTFVFHVVGQIRTML